MVQTDTADQRNVVFQKLKPCCVKISQIAIRDVENPSAHRDLIDLTKQVLVILNAQIELNSLALDEKIAEYVFFPLYHVFRHISILPMILIEHCIKCLNILIVHGWQTKISPKLVQQILGLVTFIIDGAPGSDSKREIPEETVLEAFRTLTSLLGMTTQSASAATGLSDSEAIPALGHAITVILDGVSNGRTSSIQNEALRALEGVYASLRDHAAMATFLPGTISSLTKALSTPAHYKRAVLAKCLKTTSTVLAKVLGDIQTRSILAEKDTTEPSADDEKTKLLSPAWLKATTGQVKLALVSIVKLRKHEAQEVRDALRALCLKLLDECRTTLSECAQFLVETAMILDSGESGRDLSQMGLRDLVMIYPELGEKAKTSVYNWILGLPRAMQSADDEAKRTAIYNLSQGIKLLQELNIESSTLQDSISGVLRDSIKSLMLASGSQAKVFATETSINNTSVILSSRDTEYQSVMLSHESQRGIRQEMINLLQTIGSHAEPTSLATTMLEHAQASDSTDQIAAFWICFQLVKATHSSPAAEVSEFLDLSQFGGSSGEDINEVFNELYTFSVQALDSYTETTTNDWRFEALALEVISYAAKRSGRDFRPELIDVLFPTVTFLGSGNQHITNHAMVTLNSMAQACEYTSVSELIIDNVDYMVNSAALRLNSLDISTATTRVLTMMIRLTGPRLVPFLDDVVESIFAALENYHGYPSFVEGLFSVLKELVDQAVRSDILLIQGQKESVPNHKKRALQNPGSDGLLGFLDRRDERNRRNLEEMRSPGVSGHPKMPWKEDDGNNDLEESIETTPTEKEKPPNSVTYGLLLRITELTQHYLTSPSPSLRKSLLNLISTAAPGLAADEDSFLPLVNSIWPVVMGTVYDQETFIAIEGCHALSALCAAAGDFLSSRFKTEWADGLHTWCRKAKQRVLTTTTTTTHSSRSTASRPGTTSVFENADKIMIPTSTGDLVKVSSASGGRTHRNGGGLGQHASPVRLWEAVVRLLTSIVSYVKLSEDMFEDILYLLAEVLERSDEVREALENVSSDAVWLVRYERGCVEWANTPNIDGIRFASMKVHS